MHITHELLLLNFYMLSCDMVNANTICNVHCIQYGKQCNTMCIVCSLYCNVKCSFNNCCMTCLFVDFFPSTFPLHKRTNGCCAKYECKKQQFPDIFLWLVLLFSKHNKSTSDTFTSHISSRFRFMLVPFNTGELAADCVADVVVVTYHTSRAAF